jgi:hypothetical protein
VEIGALNNAFYHGQGHTVDDMRTLCWLCEDRVNEGQLSSEVSVLCAKTSAKTIRL